MDGGGHPGAEGNTDSETIFHEIMDKVSEYQNSGTFRGKYQALKKAIKNVFDSYHGTIKLNLLISDGNMLYAFNHYTNKHRFLVGKNFGQELKSSRALVEKQLQRPRAIKRAQMDKSELSNGYCVAGQNLRLSDSFRFPPVFDPASADICNHCHTISDTGFSEKL